jgi:hypothetical protein
MTISSKDCAHQWVHDEGDRHHCVICGKEWKKPMYDVLGDLDDVRGCYGHHDEKGAPEPEICLSCPVQGSCIRLTVCCEGADAITLMEEAE